MRVGDTPVDWFINKFGATDYKLNREGHEVPKLKFKHKRRRSRKNKRVEYDYILVKSETLGSVQLHTKVAPSIIKTRFPSMTMAIYFKGKTAIKVVK